MPRPLPEPIPVAFTVNGVTVQAESAAQAVKLSGMLHEKLVKERRAPQVPTDVLSTLHIMAEVEKEADPNYDPRARPSS